RLVREQVTQVLLMAWLPAALALFAIFAWRLGRLDDVGGRRLGGSRRILAGRGQLLLQNRVRFAQGCVLLTQLFVFLAKARSLLFQTVNAVNDFKRPLLELRKALCQ